MKAETADIEESTGAVEQVFRTERQRALATVIRLLGGDFDLAEDALQDAFAEAVAAWPASGVPRNPRAWLVSTARHKGLDRLRRRARFEEKRRVIAWAELHFEPPDVSHLEGGWDGGLGDDRGDPSRAPARRAAAGRERGPRAPRRPGSLAVGPRRNRRGSGPGRRLPPPRRCETVRPASGDRRALDLAANPAEQRFLARRLADL